MTSWEERMSARARVRILAEEAREQAVLDAERAAEEAATEEQYRPVREAGPPDGCRDCYHWARYPYPFWAHGSSLQPGPPPDDLEPDSHLAASRDEWWCWHECHEARPACCAPISFAAP